MRRNLDLLAERRVRLPRSEALAELRADIVRAAYVEGDFVPRGAERLAAPALGAVALGTAVSLELGLPLVIVRLNKETGSTRMIEGELYADEEVTLIEDVVVTGSRALQAISRVSEAGARVRQVVSVLDRREGAAERFSEASVGYRHLFTPEELGLA